MSLKSLVLLFFCLSVSCKNQPIKQPNTKLITNPIKQDPSNEVKCQEATKKYTTFVDTLTEPGFNAVDFFYNYGEYVTQGLAGIPLFGPVFGAAFNKIAQKTPQELICIQELKQLVEKKFVETQNLINKLIHQLRIELQAARYMDLVQTNIEFVNSQLELAMNVNDTGTSATHMFNMSCHGEIASPQKVSLAYKKILKDSCFGMSLAKLVKIDAIVHDLFACVLQFAHADERPIDNEGNTFDGLKTTILYKFHSLPSDNATKIANEICAKMQKRQSSIFKQQIPILKSVNRMLVENNVKESGCLVGLTMSINKYSLEAAEKFARIVLDDATQIINLAIACGNVSYPDSTQSATMIAYVEKITKTIKETTDFLYSFVLEKQIKAMKQIGEEVTQYLQTHDIEPHGRPYQFFRFRNISNMTSTFLKSSSAILPEYNYFVLAAENMSDINYFKICDNCWCKFIANITGAHVIVLQVPNQKILKLFEASVEFLKARDQISNILESKSTETVASIVDAIQDIYPIKFNHYFRNAIVSRTPKSGEWHLFPEKEALRILPAHLSYDYLQDDDRYRLKFAMFW